LIQNPVEQSQDEVDIAYGYKTMDPVEVKHNADVKVIEKQIRNRYSDILEGKGEA